VSDWAKLVPDVDLWLHVDVGELHYVRDLIPTLDWEGGALGPRKLDGEHPILELHSKAPIIVLS
jgi:hypothetical protein